MAEKDFEAIQGGKIFDHIRGRIWGTPGFSRRQSTVTATMPIVGATATHVVETVHTDEGTLVFLQAILPEGTYRIVLPPKAVAAIYRQHDSIVKQAKKQRAQNAAATRRANRIKEIGEA